MSTAQHNMTRINDYDYELPDERIAKYPLAKRDESKLLLWKKGLISESKFKALDLHLPKNSLLIYNNTRVIHARLLFQKPTGARIEVFCLEPLSPTDYALSLAANTRCEWKCMVGNLKKWKEGVLRRTLEIAGETIELCAERIASDEDAHQIRFSWNNPNISFSEILMEMGELPIPPYLHRHTEAADETTYQTVYSRIEGSVAAPTAGLHFTPEVLSKLHDNGITTDELTLHVGAGTFKPVKAEIVEDHHMHVETFLIRRETIQGLMRAENPVIAVGTTSVRTLESLFYIGKQLVQQAESFESSVSPIFHVSQWEPYENDNETLSITDALKAIDDYLAKTASGYLHGETQIMIKPGFQFRLVDGIITNFHQPKSTLLLLVSAFMKGEWRPVYDYALAHDFRFLSYGDSSLLLR